MATFAELSE